MAPLTRAPEPGRSEGPGPWFVAGYGGGCSVCGQHYEEGDEIRADGYGSWEGRECQDEHEQEGDGGRGRFDGTSDEEMGF